MKYTVYQLGNLSRGNIVEVTLRGNAANVLLLDTSNYNNYKNGRRYRYYGGYVKSSPYRVVVPNDGRWFIVINLGGYSGQVRSSVRVLPGAMPPAKKYNVSELSSLFLGNKLDDDTDKEYDVFISHASEDKEEVVKNWEIDKTFTPDIPDEKREEMISGWDRAVKCSYGWAR